MSGDDKKQAKSVLSGIRPKKPPLQQAVDSLFGKKEGAQDADKKRRGLRSLLSFGSREPSANRGKFIPSVEPIHVGIRVTPETGTSRRVGIFKNNDPVLDTIRGVNLRAKPLRGPLNTTTAGANKPDAKHLKGVQIYGEFGPDSIAPDRTRLVLVGEDAKLRTLEDVCLDAFDMASSLAERATNERTPRSFGTVCNTAYAITITALERVLEDTLASSEYAAALFENDLTHPLAQTLVRIEKEEIDATTALSENALEVFNLIDMHARLSRLTLDYIDHESIEDYVETNRREREQFVVAGLYKSAVSSLHAAERGSRNPIDTQAISRVRKRHERRKDLGIFDPEKKGDRSEYQALLSREWSIKRSQGFTMKEPSKEVTSDRLRLESLSPHLQKMYRLYLQGCVKAKIDAPTAERMVRMVLYGGVPTFHRLEREKRQEVLEEAFRGALGVFRSIGTAFSDVKKYLPDDEKNPRLFSWALMDDKDTFLQRHLIGRLTNIRLPKYSYLLHDPVAAVKDSAKSLTEMVNSVRSNYIQSRVQGTRLSVRGLAKEYSAPMDHQAKKPQGTIAIRGHIARGDVPALNELTASLDLTSIDQQGPVGMMPLGDIRGASKSRIMGTMDGSGPVPTQDPQKRDASEPSSAHYANKAPEQKGPDPSRVMPSALEPTGYTRELEAKRERISRLEADARARDHAEKQRRELEELEQRERELEARLNEASSSSSPASQTLSDELFIDDQEPSIPVDIAALIEFTTDFVERYDGDPRKTGAIGNLKAIRDLGEKLIRAAQEKGDVAYDIRRSMKMQAITSDPGAQQYLAREAQLQAKVHELEGVVRQLQLYVQATQDTSLARADNQVTRYENHPQHQTPTEQPTQSSTGLTGYIQSVEGEVNRLEKEDQLAAAIARRDELLRRRTQPREPSYQSREEPAYKQSSSGRTGLSTREILEAARREKERGTDTGRLAADFLEDLAKARDLGTRNIEPESSPETSYKPSGTEPKYDKE